MIRSRFGLSLAVVLASIALAITPAAASAAPPDTTSTATTTATESAAVETDPGPQACCSKTANNSQYSVLTYKSWTCSWGTTGSSSEGCFGGNWLWLSPGQASPLFEDWDVLRIDAGWCYKVTLIVPAKIWTVWYNRSGLSSHLYVKIEDWGTAVVKSQGYGYCPA